MNNSWQNLPKQLKIFILLLVTTLALTGLLNNLNNLITQSNEIITQQTNETKNTAQKINNETKNQNTENKENIEVRFIVLSKDENTPLEKAEIKYIFEGAPASRFTNSDGYTNIEIPKRKNIDIIVKKEGYKDLIRQINLEVDRKRTIIYYLNKDEDKYLYNFKKKYQEGETIQETTTSNLSGSLLNNDRDNDSILSAIIKFNNNETASYEILETKNDEPSKYIQYDNNKSSIYLAKITTLFKDKKYNYRYEFPVKGSLNKKQILHEYKNEKWHKTLIDEKANNEQKKELEEISSTFFENLFPIFPNKKVKLGDSWDISDECNQIFSSDLYNNETSVITNSNCKANFKELTNYNGKKSALILLEGKINFKQLINHNIQDSNSESKFEKEIGRKFRNDLLKDMIAHIITDSLYNNNDLNNLIEEYEGLKKNTSSETFNKFINIISTIYEELYYKEDLRYANWEEFRTEVLQEIDKKQLIQFFIKNISENIEDKDKNITNNKSNTSTIEFKGKSYINLKSLIDTYSEIQINRAETENFKLKGEYKLYKKLI